jgi:cytochrome b
MDKQILLREAKDTEPWLSWVGYTVLGLIVLVWISVLAWGLMRMDKTERLVQRGPRLASRVPRTIT